MRFLLPANIYLLHCSGFGMCCGLIALFRKKRKAGYLYFTVFALISSFLARLYYTLTIAFYGGLPDVFNIGFLGYAAMFLCFYFANYGQMDLLIDDRQTLSPVYRLIPAVIPVIETVVAVLGLFFGCVKLSVRISFLAISVLSGQAGYYHLKHLLIPDLDDGFTRALRGYNLTALLIGFSSFAEIGLSVFGWNRPIIFVQFFMGLCYAAIFPLLEKGVNKWSI